MKADQLRVAVVGAGIAGLTAAAAMSRRGIRCEVFEQTRHLREVGAGVQIAPNATRLLHRLGLGEYLRSVAVRPEAVEMRRWDDDSVLARIDLGDSCEELFGAPYYTIHRADLHRGLLEALPQAQGVVHLGCHLKALEEHPDAVRLLFADGSDATADVAVGADGIHSVVRSSVVIDEAKFSGQTIYRGLIPAQRVPFLLEDPKVRIWLGPRQHFVCYPVSAGSLVSFGATTPGGDWRTESWSALGRVEDLAAAYAGWNDEVGKVIDAASSVSRWALHDRDTASRWSSERTTLIGDAAHPMLPFMAQGANQAIEDGVAAAVCLEAASAASPAAALDRYEAIRKARATRVYEESRANSRAFHLADGQQQARRDVDMGGKYNLRSQEWLYAYDAELAAADGPRGDRDGA